MGIDFAQIDSFFSIYAISAVGSLLWFGITAALSVLFGKLVLHKDKG